MNIGDTHLLKCAKCGTSGETKVRGILDLMRHGQTDLNLENRSVGTIDEPMNDTGRQQVRTRAEELKVAGVKLDVIMTSPLVRAHEGARIVSEVMDGVPIHVCPLLRERDTGVQNGQPETPESDAQWLRYDFTMERAEFLKEFEKKIRALLSTLKCEANGKRILCMTHGFSFLTIVKFVRGWDTERIMKFDPPHNAGMLSFVVGNFCTHSRVKGTFVWVFLS